LITGTVFDIRRYSIHDGPGIRTTVFFKGCPLDCQWCHNPEGKSFKAELMLRPGRCISCGACIDACQPDAIDVGHNTNRERCIACGKCTVVCVAEARQLTGREMSVDEVMGEIERDRVFFDQTGGGVTFTGGEPLSQPLFLKSLLIACRASGLSSVVDTSGFAMWQVLEEVQPLVDLFLYDLKLMDSDRHLKWTGVTNEKILSNLRKLSELNQNLMIRIPIIPGINDDEDNLQQTGAFLASLPVQPAVELLPYHAIATSKYNGLGLEYRLDNIQPPSPEEMQAHVAVLKEFGLQVK
jgi:pyruvate formate lyase activating enzyme